MVMKRLFPLYVLASSFFLVFLGSCTKDAESPSDRKPLYSVSELASARGGKLQTRSLKGGVTLVHFWASWCAPCLPEIPEIFKLARELEGKGIKVLAVTEDDNMEKAIAALKPSQNSDPTTWPKNLELLWDSGSKLAESFGSYMYPETYLVDDQGKIKEKWVGSQNWEAEQIRSKLMSAVKGTAGRLGW
jgi:thiol-disulfide isomerase/thioredoxin